MAVVVDPASFFWGTYNDTTFKNLKGPGVFGLRSSTNIVIDGGSIGGTASAPFKSNASVIGANSGSTPSKNITVKNLTVHDMAPVNPGDHHEGLYCSVVDGLTIDGCRFERIFANTADVFFTGWEAPGNATNVTVRGCYFGRPTNGVGNDAMQWNDTNGGFKNYLIEGNLFDGSQMNFGTLKKPVTNFVVGVNYGDSPTAAQVNAAKAMGVTFKELPFRPAVQWPGAVPSPPPPPPPPPPPVDPCADVKAQLKTVQGELVAVTDSLRSAQADLATAQSELSVAQTEVAALEAKAATADALQAKIEAAKAALA